MKKKKKIFWTFLYFFLDFLKFFGLFLGFFWFFGVPFKVTKVTTKSYQGHYWTPKIAQKKGQNSIISSFFCPTTSPQTKSRNLSTKKSRIFSIKKSCNLSTIKSHKVSAKKSCNLSAKNHAPSSQKKHSKNLKSLP